MESLMGKYRYPASHFTMLPHQLVDEVLPTLSGCELKLLIVLCRWTIGEGKATVQFGRDELRSLCENSRDSLTRATARLVDIGILRVQDDPSGRLYEIVREPGNTPPAASQSGPPPPEYQADPTIYLKQEDLEDKKEELPALSLPCSGSIKNGIRDACKEIGARLPGQAVLVKIRQRDQVARLEGFEQMCSYREALAGAMTEYRAEPAGLPLGERLLKVRFVSSEQRNGGGGPKQLPRKIGRSGRERGANVFPACSNMVKWLEERDIETKLGADVPDWKWQEVDGFRMAFPNYFEDEVYGGPVYDRTNGYDGLDGSQVMGILFEAIKGCNKREAATFENEYKHAK